MCGFRGAAIGVRVVRHLRARRAVEIFSEANAKDFDSRGIANLANMRPWETSIAEN
jgi:hypothetical protein